MKRLAFVLVASCLVAAAEASERPKRLIEAMLRLPVPPLADAREEEGSKPLTGDEPIDTLETLAITRSPRITPAIRERVMARLAAEPEILPRVLTLLPETDAAAAAAWSAFEKLPPKLARGAEFQEVREWLRRRGNYFRQELASAARQVTDEEGWIKGEEDLRAYARLDWAGAAPIVARLAAGSSPRAAALAHALLYAHHVAKGDAAAADERAALRAIVENRSAPARARDIAFEALMRTEWPGSTEWYLAQFADPTLISPTDGHYLLSPLASPLESAPDIWIPRVAPLTRSDDRVIRSNAANLLSAFQLETARADALRPLLPWLSDPAWAEDASMGRLRFVQSVARVGLREAIPGLRWITSNDPDETMQVYAADALLELQAAEAMDAVRAVLVKSTDAMGRSELEQTLVASGVLTDDEIVEALTAYASAVSTEEGRRRLAQAPFGNGASVPWQVTVGARLARELPKRDTLAQRLLALASRGDEAGRIVGKIASTMDVPAVHRALVTRLMETAAAAGDDAFSVLSLLRNREAAAQAAREPLKTALEHGGVAKGIAAVVLDDEVAISAILRTGTAEERGAALAAARLVRKPLVVSEVVEAATNAKEAAAAELEMMNTAEARTALGRLYPGEARIWGARPWADPGHTTFTFFDQWEETLRALVKSGHYDRIDALARASYWGGSGEVVVVARTGDVMQLITTATGAKTSLPRATASRVQQLLREMHPEDLEPFDTGAADGVQYEYVYLTRDGGRRVFMNNPPIDKTDPYGRLVETLSSLAK